MYLTARAWATDLKRDFQALLRLVIAAKHPWANQPIRITGEILGEGWPQSPITEAFRRISAAISSDVRWSERTRSSIP